MTRYLSLLGLGFGDCGKGLFTDHLCRQTRAHTVVRFNGGAQAGHNVVLPDGRHHTFSQFGAGTFQAGVATVLASPVVVHPTALRVEDQALQQVGVRDAFPRLMIDARCRVTTPFHQAAGRLREWARGDQAHGSCGVGVGETVRQAEADPVSALVYGDLAHPQRALDKLAAIRHALRAAFASAPTHPDAAREWAVLDDGSLAQRWLAAAMPCVRQSPPASADAIALRLTAPGAVVFEGAQGVLLDEWRGFHPHTTWSTVSTAAVEAVLADLGVVATVRHLGVLRSYLTRHGAGPLPTHDPALDWLPEPHNADAGWQGRFRRGHPDAVLLRYALDVVGPLDGLVASHLDSPWLHGGALRWCASHRGAAVPAGDGGPGPADGRPVTRLPCGPARDLAHQAVLTQRLNAARPCYDTPPLACHRDWIARVEALSGQPVIAGAFGPTHPTVRTLRPAAWEALG